MTSTVDVNVDVTTARQLHDAGEAHILDIRETDEWQAGHIAGAVHMPVAEIGGRLREINSESTWLAICRSGSRSDRITDFLRDAGVNVRNVAGGMRAWAAAGLPFAASDGGPGTVI